MPTDFTVREYGAVECGLGPNELDRVGIAAADWTWLLDFSARIAANGPIFCRPVLSSGRRALRVANYVGLVQMPSGATLEVVPKTSASTSIEAARTAVMRMLHVVELGGIVAPDADIATIKGPLREAVISRFLEAVERLARSGLKARYVALESDENFLRGRLRLSEMMSRPPHRRATFPIEFDEFSFDRPENRLLVWAVRRVYEWSRSDANRRIARSLLTHLSSIPVSTDPKLDWSRWRSDRLMQAYNGVRPWIRLLLDNQTPLAHKGGWSGMSLLFPVERLFERYVHYRIKRQIKGGYLTQGQPKAGWLATHVKEGWFCLKPDISIKMSSQIVSLIDTKWKVLDAELGDRGEKYGISQGDMYQLFAYGHKVIASKGEVFLVYPKTDALPKPLPAFDFSGDLRLWVVPFDLEKGQLVEGAWCEVAPWFQGDQGGRNAPVQ